jgi:hypothetical protein
MPPPSCGDVFFYYGRKEKKYKKKLLTGAEDFEWFKAGSWASH